MNTDLYTKTVLTVIALCLVWMCVNGATPVARAQTELVKPTPVVLVNEKGFPIYLEQQGLRVNLGPLPLPVTTANNAPLPVTPANNVPFPVSVRSIQQGSAWDPLNVRVLREPATLAPVP
jgi:hypothetical protein